MMTLRQWSTEDTRVPMGTTWAVEELGRALGMQELFTRQSPQKLKVLRESAMIESAQSSNRIEGVEVEQARIGTLIFGLPTYRDRNEEEVAGYRKALSLIHETALSLPISIPTVKQLHALARGDIWDAGKFKEKTEPIIERRSGQPDRVRFTPVAAGQATESALQELIDRHDIAFRDRRISPFILIGGFVLDFLCIHPFRDGNGRSARLLTLLLCYKAGAEVGGYISLERIIEQNKDRYYETLEQSSIGWHEGQHSPWPFVNYLLWVLKEAYKEFKQRADETTEPRGAKSQLVRHAILSRRGPFKLSDIERACPGISRDWIQNTLTQMRKAGEVKSSGRGQGARWESTNEGTTSK